MERPTLIRHPTPEAAIAAFLAPVMAEAGETDPRAFGFGGASADGQSREVTHQGVLTAVRETGLWGFTDVPNRTIHFWSNGNASTRLRLQFLGHELGHLVEEDLPEEPDLASEVLADRFGEVAALAAEMLPDLEDESSSGTT